MISQDFSASGPLKILVPAPHPCKLGQKHSPHAELGVETSIAKSSFHALYMEASIVQDEASPDQQAPLACSSSLLPFPAILPFSPSLKMVLYPVCTIKQSQHKVSTCFPFITENPVFH
jgi:hypothetical protein